jgi:hypothetical protein
MGNSCSLFPIQIPDPKFGQEGDLKLQSIKRLATSAVLTTAFGVATLAAVPAAYAAPDHAQCQRAIERTEAKLDQAVRKHGERSPQAEARRRDLNAERERCFNKYHGWWDGHEHRWHEDRDWDHR